MQSRVLYRIRKGSERCFATPSCQRLDIITSQPYYGHTVVQSYYHTVILSDFTVQSVIRYFSSRTTVKDPRGCGPCQTTHSSTAFASSARVFPALNEQRLVLPSSSRMTFDGKQMNWCGYQLKIVRNSSPLPLAARDSNYCYRVNLCMIGAMLRLHSICSEWDPLGTTVGDVSVSSVTWLWVPISPFEGKFQSIFYSHVEFLKNSRLEQLNRKGGVGEWRPAPLRFDTVQFRGHRFIFPP